MSIKYRSVSNLNTTTVPLENRFLRSGTKSGAAIKSGGDILWLSLLITSFFYCLPLGRFSIGGISSDFRIYDFMFVIFFMFAGLRQLPKLKSLLDQKSHYFRFTLALIVFVLFSSIITFILKSSSILAVMIRIYRFMMYFLSGSFTYVILDTPKKQKFILTVYYINVVVQALLAFAQGMKWLPNFWPDYWLLGYGDFPVATSSPHHLHIGVIMLIGIAISMMFFRYKKNIFIKIILILLMCIMLVVIIRAENRTVWVALVGWLLVYFFINRGKAIWPMLLLASGFIFAYALIGKDLWASLEEVINRRFVNPYELSGVSGVLGDRESIYEGNPFKLLLKKPWVIVVGAGFQNVAYVLRGATGAHNNYLQAFFELGFGGFIAYMLFLRSILSTLWQSAKLSKTRFEEFFAKDSFVLFIAILITMFAGETLWAQYSQFTLSGQIMVIIGIASSQLNWLTAKRDEK